MSTNKNVATLTFSLAANSAKLAAGLKKAGTSVGKFERKVKKNFANVNRYSQSVGARFAKMSIGIGAAAAAFGAVGKASLDSIDNQKKLAQALGTTIGEFQSLQYAADLGGVGLKSLTTSMKTFSKGIGDAERGTGLAKKAFNELGISIKNQDGTLRSQDALLGAVADKFKDMPDGIKKTALAQELFGGKGIAMINVLNDGSEALNKQRKAFKALGLTLSDSQAKGVEDANDAWTKLSTTFTLIRDQIFARLAPIFEKVINHIQTMLTTMDNGKSSAQSFVENVVDKVSNGLLLVGEGIAKTIDWFGRFKSKLDSVAANPTVIALAESYKMDGGLLGFLFFGKVGLLLGFVQSVKEKIESFLTDVGMSEGSSSKVGIIGAALFGVAVLAPFKTIKVALSGLSSLVKGLPNIGKVLGLSGAAGVAGSASGAAGGASSKIAGIAKTAGKAARMLGKLALPLAAITAVYDGWKGWSDASDRDGDNITSIYEKMTSAAGGIVDGLSFGLISAEATEKWFDKMFSGDFTQTLDALFTVSPLGMLDNFVTSIAKWLGNWLGFDTSGLDEYQANGGISTMAANYIGEAYESLKTTVTDWFGTISVDADGTKNVLGIIADKVSKVWTSLSTTVIGWFSGDAQSANKVGSARERNRDDTVGEMIGNGLKNAWTNLSTAVTGWFDFVTSDDFSLTAVISTGLSKVWDTLTTIVKGWFTFTLGVYSGIGQFVFDGLDTTWTSVTDTVSGWFDFEMPSFGDLGGLLTDKLKAMSEKVSSFFGGSSGDSTTGTTGDSTTGTTGDSTTGTTGGGRTGAPAKRGRGPQTLATGGAVWGEGTATSDSIPAMLSNGEFVINAKQTSKYRNVLEAMNSGKKLPAFKTGGSVGNHPAERNSIGGVSTSGKGETVTFEMKQTVATIARYREELKTLTKDSQEYRFKEDAIHVESMKLDRQKHYETIRAANATQALSDKLVDLESSLGNVFEGAGKSFTGGLKDSITKGGSIGDALGNGFKNLLSNVTDKLIDRGFQPLEAEIDGWLKGADPLKGAATAKQYTTYETEMSSTMSAIESGTKDVGDKTVDALSTQTGSMSGFFGNLGTSLLGGLQTLGSSFSSILSSLGSSLSGLFSGSGGGGIGSMLGGIFGGGGGGGLGSIFGSIGSIFGFANGGHVQGAGSGTSDSIPAMLSNGEFVVRAKAAQANMGLLTHLNGGGSASSAKGAMPKFANGGAVNVTKSDDAPINIVLNNSYEIATAMNTTEFQSMLVNNAELQLHSVEKKLRESGRSLYK